MQEVRVKGLHGERLDVHGEARGHGFVRLDAGMRLLPDQWREDSAGRGYVNWTNVVEQLGRSTAAEDDVNHPHEEREQHAEQRPRREAQALVRAMTNLRIATKSSQIRYGLSE